MEKLFPAYTGTEPYVFVCYAHDDGEIIYPELHWLRQQGTNLWYDEGISAGENWRSAIGNSLLGASHILFYISERSLESDHCNREINLALDEGKAIVPVYLIDIELTTDLKVGLNRVHALHRAQDASYHQHLLNALGQSTSVVEPPPIRNTQDSGQEIQPRPKFSQGNARKLIYAVVGLLAVLAVYQIVDWSLIEPRANPVAAAGSTMEQAIISLRLPLRLEKADGGASLRNDMRSIAISPTGDQIAYIGYDDYETHLYLQSSGADSPRKIENSTGATNPFFSPDGQSIAFFTQGRLQRISVSGGMPVDITTITGSTRGGSWGGDNQIVFSNLGSLMQVPAAGGEIRQITELGPGETTHRHPYYIADGEAVIFQVGGGSIWVHDFRSDQRHFLIGGSKPQYSQGRLLFLRTNSRQTQSLWSVGFDPVALAIVGEAAPIVESMDNQFAVSDNGSLLFQRPPTLEQTQVLLRDNTGTVRVLMENVTEAGKARFSPDGEMLAIDFMDNGERNIYVINLTSGTSTQVSAGGENDRPIWSPNGDKIAYASQQGIVVLDIAGNDPPTVRIPSQREIFPLQWTEVGLLYVAADAPGTGSVNIYFNTEAGNTLPIKTERNGVLSSSGAISPNGKWVAFGSNESGRMEIYVKAFPPSGPARTQVSTIGGFHPKWSEDGSQLYFMSRTLLMVVETETGGEFSHGTPTLVLDTGVEPTHFVDPFDIRPNQEGFVLLGDRFEKEPDYIYVTNWQNLLLPN